LRRAVANRSVRLLCLGIVLATACSAGVGVPAVQDGDIIFQTSLSSQSVAIQRATHSKYSHMGLIVLRDGAPYVLEASVTVKYTPLKKWIERGSGHHYELKRLRESATTLTPEHVNALHQAGARFLGRPYDLTFDWSDDRMYCSELVYSSSGRAVRAFPALARRRRVRGATLTATLRHPASLRPGRTIHSPAFSRSDESLYLVDGIRPHPLGLRPLPRPCGKLALQSAPFRRWQWSDRRCWSRWRRGSRDVELSDTNAIGKGDRLLPGR